MKSLVAVSLGCPCGLGPEVSIAAAAAERRARLLLVGDLGALQAAAEGRGVDASRLVRVPDPIEASRLGPGTIAVWQPTPDLRARDRKPGKPTAASGRGAARMGRCGL